MKVPEGKEDFEVIIVDPEGDYLYRDGQSKGPDRVRACKYMYYEDLVEEQLAKVEEELGVKLRWEVYKGEHNKSPLCPSEWRAEGIHFYLLAKMKRRS